ncbi:hypothetical protein [Trujillonella endophytica]|uniref:Uncharacterized protein n=1 Tax=Trujillonella endophytica TaxID=673521 RepID=A0A1H8UCK4_9ACTN|nr:hypothetical protein [Trujillella endophytica]SEP00901.1 hypothetical protein SAMN05660991_02784 [Trujillella endophytica]
MSRPALRRALPAGLFAAALLLTGCGSDDDDSTGASGGGVGAVDDGGTGTDTGAPEECAEAFPTAFGVADIADVELLPDDFPEPPADSTLCETGGTGNGGQEYANYASPLGEEELFAYYEENLPAGYAAERTEDGLGEPILAGQSGELYWQIESEDGGFSLVLATDG